MGPPSSSHAALPPKRFGAYEIVRSIGRGGMAEVFEARHVELGKRVAIKTMHPTIAADTSAVRRMLREGRAAASIHHPHVVEILDVGTEEGTPFLVMELLDGEDLGRRLARSGPMAVVDLVDLVLPVIAGVAAAHDAGIVHRDLKPSNVVLARRHRAIEAVVVDFGISKSVHPAVDGGTASRVVAGTPQYMAPEQVRGTSEVAPHCDQYALGVLLYECATGGTPFWGEDPYELLHAIMTASVVPPSELRPGIPRELDAAILRALARDAAARFPSVRALGAALLPLASPAARATWSDEFAAAATSTRDAVVLAVPAQDLPSPAKGRARFAIGAFAALGASMLGFAAWSSTRAAHVAPTVTSTTSASEVAASPERTIAEAPAPAIEPPVIAASSPAPAAPSSKGVDAPRARAIRAEGHSAPSASSASSAPPASSASSASGRAPTLAAAASHAEPIASAIATTSAPAPTASSVERGTSNIPIVE